MGTSSYRSPVVVAIGGNALIDLDDVPSVENQFRRTAAAMIPLAELIASGERVVLTHGNGPHVGYLLQRNEVASYAIHRVPLDSLVADTQGALGYMIQRTLRDELRKRKIYEEVITLVTEVRVDENDPALLHPSKPVGLFFTREQADRLQAEFGWPMVEDSGRGYRRVVPSPRPVRILQTPVIELLSRSGLPVIACGGGGIPVLRRPDHTYTGVEGVIDKDLASSLLARDLGAERLVITTAVDSLYRDFGTPHAERIDTITAADLEAMWKQGLFPPGSMGPKVEASLEFLKKVDGTVVICAVNDLLEGLAGRCGTRIVR